MHQFRIPFQRLLPQFLHAFNLALIWSLVFPLARFVQPVTICFAFVIVFPQHPTFFDGWIISVLPSIQQPNKPHQIFFPLICLHFLHSAICSFVNSGFVILLQFIFKYKFQLPTSPPNPHLLLAHYPQKKYVLKYLRIICQDEKHMYQDHNMLR